MKKRIKLSRMANLFGFLDGAVFIAFSLVIYFACTDSIWRDIICVLWIVLGLIITVFAAYNVQFATIEDGYIRVRNLFGLIIKEMKLSDIKRAVYADALVVMVKNFQKRRPSIVLSHKKSFRVCDVNGAYNRKKHPYLIIPYTSDSANILKEAYREVTGADLQLEL